MFVSVLKVLLEMEGKEDWEEQERVGKRKTDEKERGREKREGVLL